MAEPAPFLDPACRWPVPWQPVRGTQDRLVDRAANLALQALITGSARLPEPVLAVLLASTARLATLLDRRRVRASHLFLRQALGELDERELDRRTRVAWRHLLRVLIDSRRFLRAVPLERTPERFDVRWTEDARAVQRAKRGCILVTAHVGNWEAALALAPWIGFHPVYAVARPAKNRPLSVAIQAERERRGIRLLHRKGAMREAGAILRAGGSIALLLDHRTSGRSFLAPFFGRLARCDRSAGVLLQRHRVPVVLCSCVHAAEPLSYRVEFHEVLWPEDWAGTELLEIVTRINQSLERMILAHPEQYFWLHDRYRDTPREHQSPVSRMQRPFEKLLPGAREP